MTTTEKKLTPSSYQQAIYDFVGDRRNGSAVIIAVAGSGKTTTGINSLEFLPDSYSVQVLAFNRPIADEFAEKLNELRERTGRRMAGFRCGTFHSLGYGAVIKHLRGLGVTGEIKPNDRKLARLVRDTWGESYAELYGDFACKLVALAKGEGIGCLVPDTDDNWYRLVEHHDMFLASEEANMPEAISASRKLLTASNSAARQGNVDFHDMLYLVCLWRLRLWQNDVVIVDEAQDTNRVRRALAKLALKPGGRLFAYGDPRQAIYGFTGASHDALDLIQREFNAKELPLTCSYRCPSSVGELARRFVPYFETYEGNGAGRVVEASTMNEVLTAFDPHDVVLCRQTAPLISLAFKIIASGRGCAILGKEIGTGLVNLIKQMKAGGSIDNLRRKLEAYREREVANHTAKGEEAKAEGVNDRVACVMTVIENLPENGRSVPKLVERIEDLFSDTNGVLTLCTMHKSKGREWRRVAIYRPDFCPSKWARQDHQMQEEDNLQYVAYTRAQEELWFVTPNPAEKIEPVAKKAVAHA